MNMVQFRRELQKIQRQGYALDDEEAVLGARCVSAPVLDSRGEAVGAVSVSGPVTRLSLNQVATLADAVTSAARSISVAMGFHAGVTRTDIRPSGRKTHSVRA